MVHFSQTLTLSVNKRIWNAVLGCSRKNNRMISVCFQGKPFNITVIQVYAPTSNAKEAEVEWFYEDLQDLLERMRESFPRQVDRKSRGPQGERGLEFSRRKKGQTFHSLCRPGPGDWSWWKWGGNRQEGQGSPNGGNSLQVSDIFISLKRQEEQTSNIFFLLYTNLKGGFS